jgi:hypothetical protein
MALDCKMVFCGDLWSIGIRVEGVLDHITLAILLIGLKEALAYCICYCRLNSLVTNCWLSVCSVGWFKHAILKRLAGTDS